MNEPPRPDQPTELHEPLQKWPPANPAPRVPTRQVLDDPDLIIPPRVLARYNARVLEPASAARVAHGPRLRSTVYISDSLLVSTSVHDDSRRALTDAAAAHDLEFEPPLIPAPQRAKVRETVQSFAAVDPTNLFADPYRLQPLPGVATDVDAFAVLQTYRAQVGGDHAASGHVGLEHLLVAARHLEWTPYGGNDTAGSTASSSYADPGWGGRAPVRWIGPKPARRETADMPCRRPVVAVLDTGVGMHEWWPDGSGIVLREVAEGDQLIGLPGPVAEPENTGVSQDRLEGSLDELAGHGTFIAGLIHQLCPDAVILGIRVVPGSGYVPESVVLDALNALVARQLRAQSGAPDDAIDVLSMSFGYYDEHDAVLTSPFLYGPLQALADLGVVVVASAGNDATNRPMFPGAFSAPQDGTPVVVGGSTVPLTSVGAQNPNGTTALFSNAGQWVSCRRPGAALVSTFPQTFNGSGQPWYRVLDGTDVRSTLDPDDFTGGFGTWSGTSFAAPVFAGEIAQHIVSGACGSPDPVDAPSAIVRARDAVAKVRSQGAT